MFGPEKEGRNTEAALAADPAVVTRSQRGGNVEPMWSQCGVNV